MRVAWVTHRDIQSRSGGAEAADDDMISQRPEGVDVMMVEPGGVAPDLEDFDRVVVTGVYGFTEHEVHILSRCKPIIWAHDHQFTGHWLYTQAHKFIALTPDHLRQELENNSRLDSTRCLVNPGWFHTAPYFAKPKKRFALWAHRPEWHKGLHRAHEWSQDKGIELRVMMNRSHEEVIEAMQECEYFILLSEIFDAGPRAIMEAQLCEAELVVDQVGFFDVGPDELRTIIDGSAKAFWEAVLE